jgi:Holliday junction resolvase-like predicted endonuclease
MTDKIKTGNKGEEIAANFLMENGYEIVEGTFDSSIQKLT